MEYSVKYIYRCDDISSVDTFLSLRDVLKLEMFGDGSGIRNFEGVVADLERLFPEINIPEYDIEQLENDEQAETTFVDGVLGSLEKDCNVSRKNFKYAIWGCDTAQDVVDSYGLDDSYEINKYRLKNAVVFQDLGVEGQLYGVNECPECIYDESKSFAQISDFSDKIFKYLPFLNVNYAFLESLTSNTLEIAFDSDSKGETIERSDNEPIWWSAKLRNEAFIVNKSMDDYRRILGHVDFNSGNTLGVLKKLKEKLSECKYLNFLFLKTVGTYVLAVAKRHLDCLDDEIYKVFVDEPMNHEDTLFGKAVVLGYLCFVLGKENVSSLLGVYNLVGAKSDKGDLFSRKSNTILNSLLDQFDEISFEENNTFIPTVNGEASHLKSSPFYQVGNQRRALITNKLNAISRKNVRSIKQSNRELDAIRANNVPNIFNGMSQDDILEMRFTFEKSCNAIIDELSKNTKVLYGDYVVTERIKPNGQRILVPHAGENCDFYPNTQYKKTGVFPPEFAGFIIYAVLNPKTAVTTILSKAIGFTINDLQRVGGFGFENKVIYYNFIKVMNLLKYADFDEGMLKLRQKFLTQLKGIYGKEVDTKPLRVNVECTDWFYEEVGGSYVVSNKEIGRRAANGKKSNELEKEINMKESAEELYNRIYEECVCAAGASGISGMAPQHMVSCVDQKAGDVSRFTGGNGGRKVQSEKDVLFKNDSMNVHKRKGKKGDAITGTGIVYANGKYMENLKESLDHVFESFDWDDEIYERKRDGLPTECCNCGTDCTDIGKIIGGDVYCLSCAEHELRESTETIDLDKSKIVETKRDLNGKIESNHEGSLGDWTDQDSLVFAYDLLDKGEGDLDERAILKELYRAPYFKDLFDEIEKEEERLGGSTNNTVGWDNVASDELEHAAKEVHKILQDLKNK